MSAPRSDQPELVYSSFAHGNLPDEEIQTMLREMVLFFSAHARKPTSDEEFALIQTTGVSAWDSPTTWATIAISDDSQLESLAFQQTCSSCYAFRHAGLLHLFVMAEHM